MSAHFSSLLFCLGPPFQQSGIHSHRDRQSHLTDFSEHSPWMAAHFQSLLFCSTPQLQQSDISSRRVYFSHTAHIHKRLVRCSKQLPRLHVCIPVLPATVKHQLLRQSDMFASKHSAIPGSSLRQHAPHKTAPTMLCAKRKAMVCAGSSAAQSTTATASTATIVLTTVTLALIIKPA